MRRGSADCPKCDRYVSADGQIPDVAGLCGWAGTPCRITAEALERAEPCTVASFRVEPLGEGSVAEAHRWVEVAQELRRIEAKGYAGMGLADVCSKCWGSGVSDPKAFKRADRYRYPCPKCDGTGRQPPAQPAEQGGTKDGTPVDPVV